MDNKTKTTTACKICNGVYRAAGSCPAYGLKFRGSICLYGEVKIEYMEVKVRNDVSWWKFWRSHYSIENIIVSETPTLKHG